MRTFLVLISSLTLAFAAGGAQEEKGKGPAAGNYRGRWSTEDEKGKGPAAGDYRGRWSTENKREDESVTTDRYAGWADSGRCSARPEVKEIERERDQRRRVSVKC